VKSYKDKFCLPLILLIIFCGTTIRAQDLHESLLEDQHADNSELLQRLETLKNKPVDINTASEKTLANLPFFDDITAHKIAEERKSHGKFQSIKDFAERMVFDQEFADLISNYIKFSPQKSQLSISGDLRSRSTIQIEQSKGFKEGAYWGSPLYTYNRLTVSGRTFSSRILIHKDAGEKSLADHFAGYGEIDIEKYGVKVIAGNFSVETGQGLAVWGPYSQYKGANSIQAAKNHASGLSGYALSTEFGYMQGIALSFEKRNLSFIGFYSKIHRDAVLNEDSTASSFKESGLHRTENEIKSKGNACESNAGFSASYINNNNSAGFAIMQTCFSPSFNPETNERKRFEFKGSELLVYSVHWDIWAKDINFYGELAGSQPGSYALVTGAVTSAMHTKLALVYYHFSKDFYNPHSSFMSISPAKNREGFFCGTKYRFGKRISMSFYYDLRRTLWRTYSIPVPFYATDIFSQWELKLSRKVKIMIRINKKTGAKTFKNTYHSDSPEYVATTSLYKLRSELKYSPSKKIKLRLRFETVNFSLQDSLYASEKSTEQGYLAFADVLIKPLRKSFINLRVTIFNTQSWDTRIYEFERDLPGVLSNIALYDRGERIYITLALNPIRSFRLSAKWSLTVYPDRTYLRSGYDMIYGNKINKISIQGDLFF